MRRPRPITAGTSLLARAAAQAGSGATALFARLDAISERREHAAEMLDGCAARIRAGEWTAELAELVEQAERIAAGARTAR